MPAQTLDEVIAELGEIVARAQREADRIGYFAALYRRVTIAVKAEIANGAFEDVPRIARLVVIFANRYLAALASFRKAEHASRCWVMAFDATRRRGPIILQQLLLGMNAHINLDLAIAAAEVAPGAAFPSLKNDFDRINAILGSLVDQVQDEVESLSPALGWLDRAGDAIALRDAEVALLGLLVERPGWLIRLALLWIRVRESSNVRRNIEALATLPVPVSSAAAPRR